MDTAIYLFSMQLTWLEFEFNSPIPHFLSLSITLDHIVNDPVTSHTFFSYIRPLCVRSSTYVSKCVWILYNGGHSNGNKIILFFSWHFQIIYLVQIKNKNIIISEILCTHYFSFRVYWPICYLMKISRPTRYTV